MSRIHLALDRIAPPGYTDRMFPSNKNDSQMKAHQDKKPVLTGQIDLISSQIQEPGSLMTVFGMRLVDGTLIKVCLDYVARNSPQVGGYFARYEDGYEAYSPRPFGENEELPVKVTKEALEARIASVEYEIRRDGRTTVCEITMVNGFSVRGESPAAVVESFDKALGEKYAYDKALDLVWAFEAYLLIDRRHQAGLS
jgi:hypothetical protein